MRETVKLDKFHWHEALDRAFVVMDTYGTMVAEHPVIEQTPELNALAEAAMTAMMAVYQRVANLDPFEGDAPVVSEPHSAWPSAPDFSVAWVERRVPQGYRWGNDALESARVGYELALEVLTPHHERDV